MRTIKELLQLMLDNKELFDVGLCFWVDSLETVQLINEEEYDELHHYIRRNRPSMFSSLDAFKHRNTAFYWERDDIKPRIKWLKKHIAKN